eukprot:7941050-Pyramimonas_sp.AAC.1
MYRRCTVDVQSMYSRSEKAVQAPGYPYYEGNSFKLLAKRCVWLLPGGPFRPSPLSLASPS